MLDWKISYVYAHKSDDENVSDVFICVGSDTFDAMLKSNSDVLVQYPVEKSHIEDLHLS